MPPQAPRVFLLPKNDTATPLTVVTLPHPRTSVPTRFLVHESTGLYEITKIVPAAGAPRSWLLTPDPDSPDSSDWLGTGHTIADATLYLATPYDPLFLLLPRLLPRVPAHTGALFRPLDDLLDGLSEGEGGADEDGSHWAAVLRVQRCREVFAARVRAVSESAGAADAYRPVEGRAVAVLARKCEVMAGGGGLPASMERGVVARVGGGGGVGVEGVVEGVGRLGVGAAAAANADADANLEAGEEENMRRVLRVRTAAEFLGGTYLAAHHYEALMGVLAGRWDFEGLQRRLGAVEEERRAVAVLRRGDFAVAGGGGGGGGGGKRRKEKEKEEQEERRRRPAVVSRAVKDLGKVNTRGMAKMTSFFKKKEEA
ncbi:ribonuclease H2, subunit B [Morchella snyderi]|nr:ribonuclease H2, subunit B [Morchella snyderi]